MRILQCGLVIVICIYLGITESNIVTRLGWPPLAAFPSGVVIGLVGAVLLIKIWNRHD